MEIRSITVDHCITVEQSRTQAVIPHMAPQSRAQQRLQPVTDPRAGLGASEPLLV